MRKTKQPLTEKQMEAKRLYQKIILAPMTEHKSLPYIFHYYNGDKEETKDIRLCDINGRRYIRIADLDRLGNPSELIRRLVNEGIIPASDIIHTRAKHPIFGIIPVDTLERFDKEISEQKHPLFNKNIYDACIGGAKIAEGVGSINIPQEELIASEEAYRERCRLITENSQETRSLEAEETIAAHIEQEQKDDLSSLVQRIEDMGWEVTLRRRQY